MRHWRSLAGGGSLEKTTRRQAEYQDTPNGIYSRGLCTLFERPKGCKVAEGEDGWRKLFALADQSVFERSGSRFA